MISYMELEAVIVCRYGSFSLIQPINKLTHKEVKYEFKILIAH